MIPTLLAAVAATVLRSLAALRLERWNLGAPAVMVAVGVVVGLTVEGSIGVALNTDVAQRAAEIILAVLLFVDATEVRGGRLWGNSPGLAVRLLLVAMPLSILAAVGLGAGLFPELSWPVLLVLACVVMPVDFAPNEQVVRDRRLPSAVRSMLNVEGGYNDGILSPIFVFALLLAGGSAGESRDPLHALAIALPQALAAILTGLVLGTLLGWLLDRAGDLDWTSDQSRRIVVLMAPVLTYTAAVAVGGNGFVASFVCGIAFRYVHRVLVARRIHRAPAQHRGHAPIALTKDFTLLADVTTLLTMAMWFVVGVAGANLVSVVDLPILLFCLLALTVIRIVPVMMSLSRARLDMRERLAVGLLGPRGKTTIVFGLLAYNGLPDGLPADTILIATVLCVVGSVLLHGIGSAPLIGRMAFTRGRREPSTPR